MSAEIEALTATVDELRDEGLFKSEYKDAVSAIRQGDFSVAESVFQKQIDEGTPKLEQAYINLGALNLFANPVKAINAYKKAAEINNENPNTWVQLGTLYLRTGSSDKAMSAYEKLSTISDNTRDIGTRIKAVGFVGNVYLNTGKLHNAEQSFIETKRLAIKIGDVEYLAQVHGSLAKVYHQQGKIPEAVEQVDEAIKLFPEENKFGIANQHSLKGALFIESDLNKAERHIRESLRIFRKIETPEYIAYQLNNLGTILRRRREYPDALKVLKEALDIHKKTANRQAAATTEMNIGGTYLSLGEAEKARDSFCDALSELLELNNYVRVAETLTNLAAYHRQIDEVDKACDLYAYALRISDHSGLGGLSKTIRNWMAGYCGIQ